MHTHVIISTLKIDSIKYRAEQKFASLASAQQSRHEYANIEAMAFV